MKEIGILGYGVFGQAIGSLLKKNGHPFHPVDVGEAFHQPIDVLLLAVPVQHLRTALREHSNGITEVSLVVNLSKGIERETGKLPHEIVTGELGERPYTVVSGPSFASEIMAEIPTTVSIGGTDAASMEIVQTLLSQPHFTFEQAGTVLELELAGAMKNIYAIASGYVAGSGGGKNTHAHVQVVALREYTQLIKALEGDGQVIRPGVIGDLILTTGSRESRNFLYGTALAEGTVRDDLTAEGVATAKGVAQVAAAAGVKLPLVAATRALIDQTDDAHELCYQALGFSIAP